MGLLDRLRLGTASKSEITQENMMAMSTEEKATVDDVVEFFNEITPITRDVAEKIGALNEGIALISETIASLPVYLYKRNGNGDREKQNDYRNRLLNVENSQYSTSFNMKRNLVADYLLYGNGYLDINKDHLEKIKSLMHIPYKECTLNKDNTENKRNRIYSYNYWGMSKQPSHQVLNLARNTKDNELEGNGILKEGRKILGIADGFEQYTTNTIENGFFAKAVIEKETIITKPSKDSLTAAIKTFFSGKKNAGKVLILDDGLKLKTVSLSPADLELLQQKEFTIKDIARLLKMQPSMLGVATGGMTYSNEQDNQLQFLKNCIDPLLILIENTLNKYLLTEDEKENGYFFEFNTQNMLRTTPEKEIKMYAEAVGGTLMEVNEARRRLNWAPKENMDKLIIPLNHGIIQDDGSILGHKGKVVKGGETDE